MSSKPTSFHLGVLLANTAPAAIQACQFRGLAAFLLPHITCPHPLTPMWWVPGERAHCSASTSEWGQNHTQWPNRLWLPSADHESWVTQSLPELPRGGEDLVSRGNSHIPSYPEKFLQSGCWLPSTELFVSCNLERKCAPSLGAWLYPLTSRPLVCGAWNLSWNLNQQKPITATLSESEGSSQPQPWPFSQSLQKANPKKLLGFFHRVSGKTPPPTPSGAMGTSRGETMRRACSGPTPDPGSNRIFLARRVCPRAVTSVHNSLMSSGL